MSSKIIIIAAVILLIVSFSVLFVIETKNHDFDYKKSWSVVYFENPRDDSLDFTIENHQEKKSDYKYKIFAGDDKIIESGIEIEAGGKQEISPAIDKEKSRNKKILIEVECKDAEYKIYKSI